MWMWIFSALAAATTPDDLDHLLLELAGLSPPMADGEPFLVLGGPIPQPALRWSPTPTRLDREGKRTRRGAPSPDVLQDAAIRDLFVFLEAAGETIDRGCRPVPPEELQPALEKLAQTYQEQGKVAQARETWRRLAVEFPEDADRYHLQIFRGDVSPYDRAGHIPGAISIPAGSMIDNETGHFLPLDDVRAMFPDRPEARVVAY